LSFVNNKDKKFKKALQAAADRDYIPAKALLGHALYEEGKFKLAFKYLLSVKDTNESIALWQLYYCYTEGDACASNSNKALKYLKKAVKLKYPNALATLSIVYYYGKHNVPKSRVEAMKFLEKSIALGSGLGKQFKERIEKEASSPKQEPIKVTKETGRNEKCHCGSGKKYKKCHGKSK
jgi:TPR repeat protein